MMLARGIENELGKRTQWIDGGIFGVGPLPHRAVASLLMMRRTILPGLIVLPRF